MKLIKDINTPVPKHMIGHNW